jgi:hypothetical protein
MIYYNHYLLYLQLCKLYIYILLLIILSYNNNPPSILSSDNNALDPIITIHPQSSILSSDNNAVTIQPNPSTTTKKIVSTKKTQVNFKI